MSSKIESVFEGLAQQMDVNESDYLILKSEGIANADSLGFRVPSSSELEDFLRDTVYPNEAFETPNGIVVNPRRGPLQWPQWRWSQDAAALRKLWQVCSNLAKKELEGIIDPSKEGEAIKKVTPIVAADMERKAVARGLLPELSDYERPGVSTLSKVVDNYRVGGPMIYVKWEFYVNAEEERKLLRLGGEKESFFRLQSKDGHLRAVEEGPELLRARVEDLMALQDVLKVRAAAHEIAQVVSFPTYIQLTDEYLKALKKIPAQLMRTATLNEVMLFDRLLHEEILTFVAKGQGTLQDGLAWFLGPGRSNQLWTLIETRPETMPDQGAERPVGGKDSAPSRVHPVSAGGKKPKPHVEVKDDSDKKWGSICSVCGKSRDDHPKRRFCDRRKASTASAKAKGKSGGDVKKFENKKR
jgi:hypothetical protein